MPPTTCSLVHVPLRVALGEVINSHRHHIVQVQVIPVSDTARTIFYGLMGKNDQVYIEQAKDGEILFSSKNKQYSVWTPLDGGDWKVILPGAKMIS